MEMHLSGYDRIREKWDISVIYQGLLMLRLSSSS